MISNKNNLTIDLICPLCGPQKGQPLFKEKGNFQIYICSKCGLGQTNPYPEESNGQEHFTDSDAHFNHHYTHDRKLTRKFMQLVLNHAKPFVSTGTLLDIGANIGFMLELAEERGFKATGVEPSPAANRYVHEHLHLDMIQGFFPPTELGERCFDLITINHVFEHVPDPLNFLKDVKAHLNPGGIAVIMSPCYASLMARISGRKWAGYQPTQHIWQFTPETVGELAQRANLQILKQTKSPLGYHIGSVTLINRIKEVGKIVLAAFGSLIRMGDQVVVVVKN
jgi:2-polyprenyl-3-methyl-5-hydroxy-6-metoxy-1,4-benzoquinol methylase